MSAKVHSRAAAAVDGWWRWLAAIVKFELARLVVWAAEFQVDWDGMRRADVLVVVLLLVSRRRWFAYKALDLRLCVPWPFSLCCNARETEREERAARVRR
jgi:hypothetical protein